MTTDIVPLVIASSIWGLIHTAAGPDHYLPFVALARANHWTIKRLSTITCLCGIGHVLSSIVLAGLGILLGNQLAELSDIQESRGHWATLLLLGVGFSYLIWGLRQSQKNKEHNHLHVHTNGMVHRHEHNHHGEHSHIHSPRKSNFMWTLFVVFVLGPCESLIPLMMTAAGIGVFAGSLAVGLAFSLSTLATMMVAVLLGYHSLMYFKLPWLERHMHAVAGLVMILCALTILFLEPYISPGQWPPS